MSKQKGEKRNTINISLPPYSLPTAGLSRSLSFFQLWRAGYSHSIAVWSLFCSCRKLLSAYFLRGTRKWWKMVKRKDNFGLTLGFWISLGIVKLLTWPQGLLSKIAGNSFLTWR